MNVKNTPPKEYRLQTLEELFLANTQTNLNKY